MEIDLAKYLAHRQKRLQYWRASFTPKGLPEDARTEISNKLSTYGLLLAKLSKPGTDAELKESKLKLEELEQTLASLFELKRSFTGRLITAHPPETILMKPK